MSVNLRLSLEMIHRLMSQGIYCRKQTTLFLDSKHQNMGGVSLEAGVKEI